MDFFQEVGELGLGSRLRRLSDRMMQDGQSIYNDAGIEFKPAWFPAFDLLNRRGQVPLGHIASQLGVTHVAINQVLEELEQRKLVATEPSNTDRRVRLASLTVEGKHLAEQLTPIWQKFRAAIRDAIDDSGHDLLDAVARLEKCLERKSLQIRFKERMNQGIEIIPFADDLRDEFWNINSQWIEEHFVVEPIDARVLKNPETEILDRGGAIFFARDSGTGQVLGTCALMEHSGKWEMTKMGVRPEARGRGIGELLGKTIIDHARQQGLKKIVLETNSKLKPAINLYRKLGFVHVAPTVGSDYSRSDVTMELEL